MQPPPTTTTTTITITTNIKIFLAAAVQKIWLFRTMKKLKE